LKKSGLLNKAQVMSADLLPKVWCFSS